MMQAFKRLYPQIEFELLLGDYSEIEGWINEGRVDFAFLRLPTLGEFKAQWLHDDPLMVVLPQDHRLAKQASVSIEDLVDDPFILLERGKDGDVLNIFEKDNLFPNIQYRTWDDYAIMAMVENHLGVNILPQLILQRLSYHVTVLPLENPVYRKIGLVYKSADYLSIASRAFLELIADWQY